jgi:hypothetical protein
MDRLRGTLLLSVADHAAAEESVVHSQSIAGSVRRRSNFVLPPALARLWRDQSKRIEARNLLAPVYDWFTEGFDTPVLKDAKALLDQLT